MAGNYCDVLGAECQQMAALRSDSNLTKEYDAEALKVAKGQRDEARRFGEDAAEKHNELLKQMRVTCVYCGWEYPKDTPRYGSPVLFEHIKICKKHPMRVLEKRVAKALYALRDGWCSVPEQRRARWILEGGADDEEDIQT